MAMLMIFSIVYLLLLSLIVVTNSSRKNEKMSLLGATLLIGVWILSVYGLQTPAGEGLEYARLVFVLGLFSALGLLQFIGFMTLKESLAKKLLFLAILWAAVFSVIVMGGELVIRDIYVGEGQMPTPHYGGLIYVYVLGVVAPIATTISLLFLAMAGKTKLSKQQALTIGLFALASIILALFSNIIIPYITNNSEFALLLPLAAIVLVTGLTYSVTRQGLFDIRLAVIRTTTYSLSIVALSLIYFGLAYTLSSLIFREDAKVSGISTSPLNILLALILAFIFQPIKHFFDQVTNKIFYRGEYDRDIFFREFGQILSYDTNLKLLLRRASSYITDNLKAERAYFQIVNRGVFGGTAHDQVSEVELSRIVKYYKENIDQSSVVVADLVQSDEVRGIMSRNNIRIALPLMSKNHLIGCLFLGEHKSRGYSARDIGVLESVTNELTIAISNSLSVEEIRDLNASLQQRVNEATKELTMTNKQLRKLDETKDEFISMASHQLRTPLTSIKGYLDMVLQGDLGKINATQRAALSDAYLSSERMVSLINDFLNISRLQTGKFIIDRRNSDVSSALYQELQMLSVLAKQHGLELDLNVDKNMPPLLLDIDKLRQVIVNMIDNAIYYSKPNTAIKIRLGIENGELIFSVQDTGIGVPKSEQDQLFGKFFRATNARKRRPDGTGVGLFLSKKVVLAHGGQIIFQSIEGDGSIFGFRIPVTVE